MRDMRKRIFEIIEVAEDDDILSKVYRTLLTRGMKGCYIYCTDKGMSEYLKKRLEIVKK